MQATGLIRSDGHFRNALYRGAPTAAPGWLTLPIAPGSGDPGNIRRAPSRSVIVLFLVNGKA